MFGIKLESDQFFRQIAELISRLDEAHLLTVAVGVVCMATLLIVRRVNHKIPGPLIVVVGAILASVAFDLAAKGVAVVGPAPPGLPQIAIPAITLQDIFALLPAALALTILIYADEILTSRVFATKHGQKVDANQEFVALGLALALFLLFSLGFFDWAPLVFPLWVLLISVHILLANLRRSQGDTTTTANEG
jgi:SulP family sulfate permease